MILSRRKLRRYGRTLQGNIFSVAGRTLALIFGVILLIIPAFIQDPYVLKFLTFTNIFVIYAVSWDLLCGYAGQISLGHSAFLGISAYATALLNTRLGLDPWLSIPMGAIICILAGLIIALPSLRLRGPYFALATLAFPIIIHGIVLIFSDFFGGEMGISGLAPITLSRISNYYIVLAVTAISVVIMWKLTDAKSSIVRTGVVLHAIREEEIGARAIGINTTRYKLLAFCVSGFFAGIAGGLYTHTLRVAGPSTLELWNSILPVIWTVFGGMISMYGPAVGVYVLYPMMELLRAVPEYRMLIFGMIAVLVLVFMPEGIAVWIRDKLEETCPRCKLSNVFWRKKCRACGAALQMERGSKAGGTQETQVVER